ncbi:GNAT family protein [uncultured Tateyamaria sp.]|uniref:GNAT family N-acetyltransferase n=1 Tax=uncultured Tateyamaria sp. TaxID=455651 RepID=UPI00261BD8CA|nr:GNAT family protein [uncultured Tateyamaria sp.]
MAFPDQPTLTGPTLRLRPLSVDDHAALAAAASDPAIWAGHPARDRHKPDVFTPYFDMLLDAGGTLVITEGGSGAVIGCSRYYPAPEGAGEIGIGFTFLTTAHWGGTTNRELKTLMLDHAFRHVDRLWFHIGPSNIRSQKATAKLGAKYIETRERSLGKSPGMWMCYALEKSVWQAAQASGSG